MDFATLTCGLLVYTANVGVGVLAWLYGRKFGRAHHVIYGFNCVTAGLSTFLYPGVGMIVVLACLAAMPKTRPAGPWHRGIATVGQIAYVGVWLPVLVPDASETPHAGVGWQARDQDDRESRPSPRPRPSIMSPGAQR